MYYCFPLELKEKIVGADSKDFIYFDIEDEQFKDIDGNVIDIDSKQVLVFDHIFGLFDSMDFVEEFGGTPINSMESIEKVIHWSNEFEPYHRTVSEIFGSDFEDLSFLTSLFETYGVNGSVFVKTVDKDFHGIIPITDIVNPDSPFRKTMKGFLHESFLISPVMSIDEDELGKLEYRAFIHNGVVTSISRTLHKTYHRIPNAVVDFVNQVIQELPRDFPTYFVLDVVQSGDMLDVLEFNPIETSVPYLYNSRKPVANPDLTHENMTNIPNPNPLIQYSVDASEEVQSPTFDDIPLSFAYEYQKALQQDFTFEPSASNLKQKVKQ